MGDAPLRNGEVDWDLWPVEDYLAENYRKPHPSDLAVINHHGAIYRHLAPDSVGVSLELGAGPNLYPLMLAAAVSRDIHAVERGAANVAYLTQQVRDGPDASWSPFYAERLNLDRIDADPTLPDYGYTGMVLLTARRLI